MSKAFLTVGEKKVPVGYLDVIRVVAYTHGYDDVDVDGTELTARGPLGEITVRGKTLEELCDKFCLRVMK